MTLPPVEPSGRRVVEPGVTSGAAGAKDYRKRIGNYLLILTGLAGFFLFMNAPQCPEHFTQEQVDASRCIVGANIGLGLYLLFAGPVFIVVLVLLILALYRQCPRSAAGEGRQMAQPDGGTAIGPNGGDGASPAATGGPASDGARRDI